ncbi:MAG: hypothetical protein IT380_10960 [Myxococcales bacterium]|nr:hypothetical protein [Myxococcales bacterium]
MLWLVRSAIVALYPSGGALPGAADCGLDGFLRRFRREAPALVWLGVVLGALVFHFSAFFTVFVPLPAFLLPAGLRDRHASRIASTNVYLARQGIFLVKLAAGLCWGADAEVRRRLALPPLPADPGTWRTS